MAVSLQVEDIERAGLTGVRAALHGIVQTVPSPSLMVSAPQSNPQAPPAASTGASSFATTLVSLRSVLPLLKENPHLRVLLDMPEEPNDVTADVVAALLKPNYSVLGINRRPKEELMVVKFREFLHCVQDLKEVGECLHTRNLTEAEKAFILTLNPGHILAFAT